MRSNFKRLGNYIEELSIKNIDLTVETLLGVSMRKVLIPSIANIIGSDMSKYKIIKRNQFGYGPVTSRNGDKISIALLTEFDKAIISQSYKVFDIKDKEELLPEYLMMWFSRPEFDRYARFMSHGSTREAFDWEELCEVELPIPPIEEQKAIVAEYKTVTDRIKLNEQINIKLEETAQALYRHWFVDFEFPDKNGKPYKSSGGNMVFNEELEKEVPEGWEVMSLGDLFVLQRGFDLPTRKRTEGIYPIYASTGVSSYHNEFKIEPPGVVTGRSGSLGEVFFVDERFWALNTTLWIKEFKRVNPVYSFFYLSNINISEFQSGSAVPTLNRNHIHMHRTYCPSFRLQEKFQSYYLKINRKSNNLKLENKKCKYLQSLLLSKMAGSKTSNHKKATTV